MSEGLSPISIWPHWCSCGWQGQILSARSRTNMILYKIDFWVYIPLNVSDQLICLLIKQLPLKKTAIEDKDRSCLLYCFYSVWKVVDCSNTCMPITQTQVQTRMWYLNSEDFQSKNPACITPYCLWSNPREAVLCFLHWFLGITFPPPHHVWMARQNKLQTACTWNKSPEQQTATMKDEQHGWYLKNLFSKRKNRSSHIFCKQASLFICCNT